ncbi:hypothetical protein B296_00019345 [Ensete ventricosum]|uniref:Uncharacterized protein n=1 Tax=Ensete ventricosum TaxID=4639 RepID=A0A426YKX6_ENSVE|nr:hypothetical protein B296_00019345 [Ensete ventricosum]
MESSNNDSGNREKWRRGIANKIKVEEVPSGRWEADISALVGPYRPVYTGPAVDRYADRPLPGGTTKIGLRQSVSVVDGRLRKKKERRRRGKEEEEEEEKYLASLGATPPGGRSRAVAALAALAPSPALP